MLLGSKYREGRQGIRQQAYGILDASVQDLVGLDARVVDSVEGFVDSGNGVKTKSLRFLIACRYHCQACLRAARFRMRGSFRPNCCRLSFSRNRWCGPTMVIRLVNKSRREPWTFLD
jgi:hypothetical protein